MQLNIRRYLTGTAAFAAALSAGCAGTQLPDLYHPGGAGQQRRTALQYDPYPLDDIAPPVAGGRPPEYAKPIPEPVRAQMRAPVPPSLRPGASPWTATASPGAPPASPFVTTTPPPGGTAPLFTAPVPPPPAATVPLAPLPGAPVAPSGQSFPAYQVRPPY